MVLIFVLFYLDLASPVLPLPQRLCWTGFGPVDLPASCFPRTLLPLGEFPETLASIPLENRLLFYTLIGKKSHSDSPPLHACRSGYRMGDLEV